MLLAAGLSRGVDPLLQARNPSDFALDFGVEQQAPAHKPFGWDAYWGAADPHAGPSHSFARQQSALLEQQAAAAAASSSRVRIGVRICFRPSYRQNVR